MTLPVLFNRWYILYDSWSLGLCVLETLRKNNPVHCPSLCFPYQIVNLAQARSVLKVECKNGLVSLFSFQEVTSPFISLVEQKENGLSHPLMFMCSSNHMSVDNYFWTDSGFLVMLQIETRAHFYTCNFNVTAGKSVSDIFFLINPLIVIVFRDRTHSPHIISLSHFRLHKES